MDINDFLDRLEGVKGSGGQYTARCPSHGDQHSSLSVAVGDDGRILLHCHAGCSSADVAAALGLSMKDLFTENTTPKKSSGERATFEAEYFYRGGDLKKVKMREPGGGKRCYWMHLEDGAWKAGRNGIEPGLYTPGPLGNGVLLVEGERDAESLNALGMSAASLPDGASSKWLPQYSEALRGKAVFVVQDNDQPGKAFAQMQAAALQGVASSLKVLDLTRAWPELPEHGDVSDLLEHLGAADGWAAVKEIIKTIPEWVPPAEHGKAGVSSLVRACDVPYEPPRWVLAPYIQRGKGTLIQADNGMGKTAFVCAIAAHVSTGKPLLGVQVEKPGDVLLLSVEDDLPILRGRIEANGGDLTKCHFLTNAAGQTFNSPDVEAAVKQVKASLVVFDPLQAFLGAKVDMFRANETRPQLAKLFEMCDRNDCACIVIAHMSKGGGDKTPVNRALGSVDIPAAMRSVIQIIQNPENENERIAVHVKCSNAPKGDSIAYSIGDRGGVRWEGFSNLTDGDLMTVIKRKEKGIVYENEPLVKVFNQIITDKPGGGFISYSNLKEVGAKILGFPPFSDITDLRQRLDGGLARELQAHDGLIVTHSATGKGNVRGIKIEQYEHPQGYQTKIS